MNEGLGNVCRDALMSAHKAYWTSRSCADLESDANDYRVMSLCRGFSIQRCIMLKHLSKEAEETLLGSQSPPAKRPCSDLQVNHELKPSPAPPKNVPFQTGPKNRCNNSLTIFGFTESSCSPTMLCVFVIYVRLLSKKTSLLCLSHV